MGYCLVFSVPGNQKLIVRKEFVANKHACSRKNRGILWKRISVPDMKKILKKCIIQFFVVPRENEIKMSKYSDEKSKTG